jgi:hypothetical protein
LVNEESLRRALPGNDDHDLERRLREGDVEPGGDLEPDEDLEPGGDLEPDEDLEADKDPDADEEMTLAEARWLLKVTLVLALVVGAVAFSGVSTVPHALPGSVLGALEQARHSSTAALRSAVGESVRGLSAVARKVSAAPKTLGGDVVGRVGAVASKVSAVPKALGGDVVGALQQARDSSSAALRSAVGEPASLHSRNSSHAPFHRQYHSKVLICLPNVLDHVYATRSVSARSVPSRVSQGAIYPVPAGGC